MSDTAKRLNRCGQRRALSAVEILVALTLLGAGLTLSGSLMVKHGRLRAEERRYRLALDELSNQLERLADRPADELAAALENLEPSPFAADHLIGATLGGEVRTGEWGRQLKLTITWEGRPTNAPPLTLSAWLTPKEVEP